MHLFISMGISWWVQTFDKISRSERSFCAAERRQWRLRNERGGGKSAGRPIPFFNVRIDFGHIFGFWNIIHFPTWTMDDYGDLDADMDVIWLWGKVYQLCHLPCRAKKGLAIWSKLSPYFFSWIQTVYNFSGSWLSWLGVLFYDLRWASGIPSWIHCCSAPSFVACRRSPRSLKNAVIQLQISWCWTWSSKIS